MDARPYWNHYVETNGGPVGVAAKLDIPYSTIAGVCNGSRGIGHSLASRMAKADPILDANKLVWVRPIKEPDPSHRTPAVDGDAAEATEPTTALKAA